MTVQSAPSQPSLPWRLYSSALMGFVGGLSRSAMIFGNRTEVHGLERFKALVDERQDPAARQRGLITVSNHTSVIDDPFLWGALPLRYAFRPDNLRWTPASYDICFQGKLLTSIFNHGQLLPTHRKKHSQYGGLFQPAMTEAIRLLSDCPVSASASASPDSPSTTILHKSDEASPSSSSSSSSMSTDISDPFSSTALTYSTDGHDSFPRPSAYASRRHAWIHIFPEGFVHQHPGRAMRYFKWGVARLILEADVCPDVVPIWHEGTERIMPEDRAFPRFVPRLGQRVGIWFGDNVAGARSAADGNVFEDLRARWQALVAREEAKAKLVAAATTTTTTKNTAEGDHLTVVSRPESLNEALKYGDEAVRLRMECTMKVREAVLEVRRQRGLPDEDPKARLVDTYREEKGRLGEGRKPDGSWVKDI